MTQAAPEFDPFEDSSTAILLGLRSAWLSIVEDLPERVGRPQDLVDQLGLNRNLGWKLFRVTHGPESLPAPKLIPGPASVDRFFEAARQRGVPAALVARGAEAYEQYRELMRVHAGDRASLDILLAQHLEEGRPQAERELLRAAFRANSYVLGIQTRAINYLTFVYPGEGKTEGAIFTRGYYGLRRNRPGLRWLIGGYSVAEDTRLLGLAPSESLGEAAEEGAAPLVQQFCSIPVARTLRVKSPNLVEDFIEPSQVGEQAAADIVQAERTWGTMNRFLPRENERGPTIRDYNSRAVRCVTPCEYLQVSLFFHRDILRGEEPWYDTYTTVLGPTRHRRAPEHRIPFGELKRLGPCSSPHPSPSIPHYQEFVDFVFGHIDFPRDEFIEYRVSLDHPPIPIELVTSYRIKPE